MDHPDANTLLQTRPLLRCESQHGALICLTCNNGFPLSRVRDHLSARHHYPKKLYEPAIQAFKHEALADDWKDLLHPVNGMTPIEGLKMRPGFTCTGCGHLTINDKVARGHSKCGGEIRQVDLQRWNSRGAPSYWIVTHTEPTLTGSSIFDCFFLMI
jgi:Orsellinic acid/F9775 biosynthesis cluster protein D